MGKLYVFGSAIQANYVGLAVLGVLNSVVSAFYYLRLTVVMSMTAANGEAAPGEPSPSLILAVALAAAGTLALGLFPAQLFGLALRAVGITIG
jgi:NADH-quinone oxidoreductase subunit N